MRLIELKVQNFQRIRAVAFRPNGPIVSLTGRNSQGKTSILKAIWLLLKGRAAEPPVIIRQGEEQCTIFGDFGEIKVTRTFNMQEGGDVTHSLKIVRADGSPITTKQQSFLDALLPKGDVAFDPLEFSRRPAKEQYETLKRLVPGVDFDKIAAERKRHYEARTVSNRRAEDARAAAASIQLPEGPRPKPVDVSAKLDEMAAAGKHNAAIDTEQARRTGKLVAIERTRDRITAMRKEIAELERRTDDEEEELNSLPPIPAPVSVEALRAEIAQAEIIKGAIALFDARKGHEDRAEAFEAESASHTTAIETLDKAKADALAMASLPVKGLTIGDGEVLFNGLPFSQAGTASKLKVATAIQMALKPEIKVMTLDEGSELDQESLEWLEMMADREKWTIVIARVDESGNGLVIEDGQLLQAAE